jgi:hypothetical protein
MLPLIWYWHVFIFYWKSILFKSPNKSNTLLRPVPHGSQCICADCPPYSP